ncbi:hypothetical protein SEPCBS119000_000145 [Sporothrix epigloea]|uniref:Uncharacterized protein n=1 Tax=Sporothrix epigloea TaxID=1892477 RepID=A0ABP0D744_9PEZI
MPAVPFAKALLVAALALPAVRASSDSPMVPSYEVHLQLDPTAVLNSSYSLIADVLDEFAMPASVTEKNVQYIDTVDKALDAQGWSCRIRNIQTKAKFDLTYKWRLAINDSDIDAALNTALNDGWNSDQSKYEAQVDWYLSSQELSVQRDHKASEDGYSGLDDPSEQDSQSLLIDNAPKMFDNWAYSGWGTTELGSGVVYGPVLTKASAGTWNGVELDIEVWPIENAAGTGIDYLVEASFKTSNYTFASVGRTQLQDLLTSKGWFLDESNSKEAMVLANYHPTA